jgi:hypothetical protein
MALYLRWFALALLDYALLLTVPFAALIVAARTSEQPYGLAPYSWGGLYGTYDNPPQGDEGYVRKRAPFIGVTTGFKGYVNRVVWMLRNPLYGFQRRASVEYKTGITLKIKGKQDISDKYKVPGWYFVRAYRNNKLYAFELYAVLPWPGSRCLRVRLGWKLLTDKFERYGFAQLVDTVNPLKSYGD